MPSAAPNSATGPAPTPAPGRARAARFLRRHWANLLAAAMLLWVLGLGLRTELRHLQNMPSDSRGVGALPLWTIGGFSGTRSGLARQALDPAHHSAVAVLSTAPLGGLSSYEDQDSGALHIVPAFAERWVTPQARRLSAAAIRLAACLFLGISLWYVSRRLYGTAGGLVALAAFCGTPAYGLAVLLSPVAIFSWGAYGAIFCGVAVAHTLYAPRPVILWNLRRILLLGVSLALAVGTDYVFLVLPPVVLGLMWFLAPARKLAASLILLASCGVAAIVFLMSYGFNLAGLASGVARARPFELGVGELWQCLLTIQPWGLVGWATCLLLALSIVIMLIWKRARYFGNLGSLAVGLTLFGLGLLLRLDQALALSLAAVPFLCQAIGGVASDLLETRARRWLAPALVLALGLQAYLTFSSFYY